MPSTPAWYPLTTSGLLIIIEVRDGELRLANAGATDEHGRRLTNGCERLKGVRAYQACIGKNNVLVSCSFPGLLSQRPLGEQCEEAKV